MMLLYQKRKNILNFERYVSVFARYSVSFTVSNFPMHCVRILNRLYSLIENFKSEKGCNTLLLYKDFLELMLFIPSAISLLQVTIYNRIMTMIKVKTCL